MNCKNKSFESTLKQEGLRPIEVEYTRIGNTVTIHGEVRIKTEDFDITSLPLTSKAIRDLT